MTSLWRGTPSVRLRLVSGLVLFAFAATHFVNHALGLVSLDAMLAFEHARTVVTRSLPGSLVLLAALIVHAGFGFSKILRHRSLSMPIWEAVQIVTGIAIPLLLLPHIVNTRVASLLFGVHTSYSYELPRIWPAAMADQSVLLLLVWVHGCVGIHFWLRLSPRYRVVEPVLFAAAVLVPFAALAGVMVQGRAMQAMLADPDAEAALRAATHWPDAAQSTTIVAVREQAQTGYIALLGVGFVLAAGAAVLSRRGRSIPVQYVGGPLVRTEPGPTILEISRRHNLPHVSVCGGRGRCSTCRVLVLDEGAGLPPPDDAERRTLRAIGAGPHVRLACRAAPNAAVTVLPLVKSASALVQRPGEPEEAGDGVERELAVLFVDLRGFTALTERKLPFDIIYILNQFFTAVGKPVQDFGGWIANYAGDGVIALFSDPSGMAAACRSAMLAAAEIDRAMQELSARLEQETRSPLRIAMGLHAGPHVMGRVGFGTVQPMSVVGLAINVASRLEALAKQENVQLALSGTVATYGTLDTSGLRIAPIEVRGVSRPLDVIFVRAASELMARLGPQPAPGTLADAALP